MPRPHRRRRQNHRARNAASEVQNDPAPQQPRPNAQPQPRQYGDHISDTGRVSRLGMDDRQRGITVGHILLVLCLALASGVANK